MDATSNPEYVFLSLNNNVFESEKELLEFIQKNYVKQVPRYLSEQFVQLKENLQNHFPNSIVKIEKISHGTTLHISLHYTGFDITLCFDSSNKNDNHFNCIENMCEAFKEKVSIIESILEFANGVKSLDDFRFESHFSGYVSDEEVFSFSASGSIGERIKIEFFPCECTIQEFFNSLKMLDCDFYEVKVRTKKDLFKPEDILLINDLPLNVIKKLNPNMKMRLISY